MEFSRATIKVTLISAALIAILQGGSAGSVEAACDVKAEKQGLKDRMLALHAPTRGKRMQVQDKWQHWVNRIVKKRGLKGKALADYVEALEIRVAEATMARAVANGNAKLMELVLDKIFSVSDINKLPLDKACAYIADLEQDFAKLIRRVDQQIEGDWAESLKILQAELARHP